tara:strand:+ start:453 stop:695 length:243 start_codon:yes stop_codon:yes gene_type:complete
MAQVDKLYLEIMQMDNVDLLNRSQEQTHEGKLIRKEITRRKNCGNIWIGPHIKWTIGDEVIETPSTVGTVRIVKGGTSVR